MLPCSFLVCHFYSRKLWTWRDYLYHPSSIMPTKEEIEAEMYGTGPRKRKEAQAIDDSEGWFW